MSIEDYLSPSDRERFKDIFPVFESSGGDYYLSNDCANLVERNEDRPIPTEAIFLGLSEIPAIRVPIGEAIIISKNQFVPIEIQGESNPGETIIIEVQGESIIIENQREAIEIQGKAIEIKMLREGIVVEGEAIITKIQREAIEIQGTAVIIKMQREAIEIQGVAVIIEIQREAIEITALAVEIKMQGEGIKIQGEGITQIQREAIKIIAPAVEIKMQGEGIKIQGEAIITKIKREAIKIQGKAVEIQREAIEIQGTKMQREAIKIQGNRMIAKIQREAIEFDGEAVKIKIRREAIITKIRREGTITKIEGEQGVIVGPVKAKMQREGIEIEGHAPIRIKHETIKKFKLAQLEKYAAANKKKLLSTTLSVTLLVYLIPSGDTRLELISAMLEFESSGGDYLSNDCANLVEPNDDGTIPPKATFQRWSKITAIREAIPTEATFQPMVKFQREAIEMLKLAYLENYVAANIKKKISTTLLEYLLPSDKGDTRVEFRSPVPEFPPPGQLRILLSNTKAASRRRKQKADGEYCLAACDGTVKWIPESECVSQNHVWTVRLFERRVEGVYLRDELRRPEKQNVYNHCTIIGGNENGPGNQTIGGVTVHLYSIS